MKQKKYILGLVAAIIVVLGTIFKLNHWPAAGILLTLGMLLFVLVFLPLALISNYRKENNPLYLPLYITIWITCLVVFGSMLFKIMHWPGAGTFILLALPFPFVVFLPVYLFVTSKIKNYDIYNTVFVLFLVASQGLFSAILALNVSREKIEESLVLSSNYNRVAEAMEFASVPADGGIPEYSRIILLIDEATKIIDECQSEFLKTAGVTETTWINEPGSITLLDTRSIGTEVMLFGEGETRGAKLESVLSSLLLEIKSKPELDGLSALAPVILDFDGQVEAGWAERMFADNYLSWLLIYFDELELNLKFIKTSLENRQIPV